MKKSEIHEFLCLCPLQCPFFSHLPAQLPTSSLSSYLSQRYGTGSVRQKEIKIVEPTFGVSLTAILT